MINLQECQISSIPKLYSVQFQTRNTFSMLHSVFGYTKTEWMIEKNNISIFKEFVITNNEETIALFRLKAKDSVSQSIELQLHCLESDHFEKIMVPIQTVLSQLSNFENINRFYCFLFQNEQKEQQVLESLGFIKEATFDDHIYSNGTYLDLNIFGSKRGAPNDI